MGSLAAFTSEVAKKFNRRNPDIVYDPSKTIQFISSGNVVFDLVSGGGFPRGRITEVFGMEHSCKTAITLSMAAAAQKRGEVGIFMDHETAWAGEYAKNVYGLVDDGGQTFKVFQPDNLEEGDDILSMLAGVDKIDYIIFDSVDAMRPKDQIAHNLSDGVSKVGAHAQSMSRVIQKARILARKKNCAIIFINQMRTVINTTKGEQNVGTGAGYNVMETYNTTGGHALRFYASLRIKMEYGGQISDESTLDVVMGDKDAKIRRGNKIKVINIKNKVATPFLKGLTNFYFPMQDQVGGFSKGHDLLELLKRRGKVRQQATKFVYETFNTTLGNDKKDPSIWSNLGSKDDSERMFISDPALVADAEAQLKALTGGKGSAQIDAAPLLDNALLGEDFTDDEEKEDYTPAPGEEEGVGITLEPTAETPSAVSEIAFDDD